ncbi:capsular polysaccharide/lipopolysaccharide/teichoic acids ABC transporter inner membrane subunit [Arthrobacter crystallopoietes BAB-32]|uniref:Transport permease protein n=1 Tax=Arthrobacter crystallopoietes BAB-32 TaxID=1246476 RepID=N1V2U1_9MICC|nr:ABC transporter permease [Arthrobacter crystallopoietes]EMY34377.1 capsular polysaccharide/lipopolysaccharide/teichoic acids ABC transporter inner membrane subunit [Arthrobacter crystallopoietes BAB-32]
MSLADYADRNQLHRVGARPSLPRYLAEAWSRRDFAIAMAKYKIEASNQRNRLGMLWIFIKPTLNAIMYGVIFGVLQGASRPENFPMHVVIGVFLFEFFSTSMNSGAKSITGNGALVQSLAFPRITLPLSTVIQQLMTLVPMLGVMVVYILILGAPIRPEWLLVIPLVAIFTVFNLGVALIGARLTVHIRDLTQLLPLVTRILFYTSGVLFSIDRILAPYPWAVALFDFHPLHEVLSIARGLLMPGVEFDPVYWLYFSVWAVVVFVAGILFFWSAEERYGRVD